jgi:hypothetical protein
MVCIFEHGYFVNLVALLVFPTTRHDTPRYFEWSGAVEPIFSKWCNER